MAIFKCLVNGAIDADTRSTVSEGLARITHEHFGDDTAGVQVEFIEVERGRWFTAGEPSRASMVLGTVPPGTEQDRRETVMDEIARFFSSVTDTEYPDVMVVAADARD